MFNFISRKERKIEKLKHRKIKNLRRTIEGRDERYYEAGRIKVILKSLELEILVVASSKSGIN